MKRILFGIVCALLLPVSGARAAFQLDDVLVSYFDGAIVRQYRAGAFVRGFSGVAGARVGAAARIGAHLVTAYRGTGVDGVAAYAANGNELGSPVISLAVPTDVAVFGDGTIAVASQNGDSVRLVSEAGADLGTITKPGVQSPFGIAIARDDTLWLVNRVGQDVDHFARNGADLGGFALAFEPRAIAVDPADGTLWIANNGAKTIVHRSKSGAAIGSAIGTSIVGDFDGLGMLSDGTLLAFGYGDATILLYARDGSPLGTIPLTAGEGAFRVRVVPEPSAAAGTLVALAAIAARGQLQQRRRARRRGIAGNASVRSRSWTSSAQRWIVAVAALALGLAPGGARAMNLLQNGGFANANALDGWTFQSEAIATWTSLDVNDSAKSGSVLVENSSGVPASYVGGLQCVGADENVLYELRGSVYIPASDAGEAGALASAQFFDNPTCTLPALETDILVDTEVAGEWITSRTTTVSPPGTTHVRVRLDVHQLGSPPDLPGAHFDALFVPEPAAPVLGAGAAAALAACAAASRSRRRAGRAAPRPNRRFVTSV